MSAVNEKCTETITPMPLRDFLWSIHADPPEVVDVRSGLVLWTGTRFEPHGPAGGDVASPGLPSYCSDLLDLDELDPQAVAAFHSRYGHYWEADYYANGGQPRKATDPDARRQVVYAYALARFQDEVRALRACVAIARAAMQNDYERIGLCLDRYHRRKQMLGKARNEAAKSRWHLRVNITRSPLMILCSKPVLTFCRDEPEPLPGEPFGDTETYFLSGLRPQDWETIRDAWTESPDARPSRSKRDADDRESLREFAREAVGDMLFVPSASPSMELRWRGNRPESFVSWELQRLADFVRIGIMMDIGRGLIPSRCASATCRRYFVPSRRRQVYCTMPCQRAQAVRRYRRRQAAATAPTAARRSKRPKA